MGSGVVGMDAEKQDTYRSPLWAFTIMPWIALILFIMLMSINRAANIWAISGVWIWDRFVNVYNGSRIWFLIEHPLETIAFIVIMWFVLGLVTSYICGRILNVPDASYTRSEAVFTGMAWPIFMPTLIVAAGALVFTYVWKVATIPFEYAFGLGMQHEEKSAKNGKSLFERILGKRNVGEKNYPPEDSRIN